MPLKRGGGVYIKRIEFYTCFLLHVYVAFVGDVLFFLIYLVEPLNCTRMPNLITITSDDGCVSHTQINIAKCDGGCGKYADLCCDKAVTRKEDVALICPDNSVKHQLVSGDKSLSTLKEKKEILQTGKYFTLTLLSSGLCFIFAPSTPSLLSSSLGQLGQFNQTFHKAFDDKRFKFVGMGPQLFCKGK